MSNSVILTEIDSQGIGTIILNRPEVNNAYNSEMIENICSTIENFSADDNVRAVIIRGNGRHFQAGADLKWIADVAILSEERNIEISQKTANAVRLLNACQKPTIALVHGGCFGGGTGIVAACDIVIASSDALFAISEVRWGLHAGPILPYLTAAIGLRNLRRLALSGEQFDAYEGEKFGLVHVVCEEGQLDNALHPIINMILQNGPRAISDTKRIILEISDFLFDEVFDQRLTVDHAIKRRSKEAKEGLRSFTEKRQANWYKAS